MDQNSVDDLLAQIQDQTKDIAQQGGAAAVPPTAPPKGLDVPAEVPGEMAGVGEEGGLAGDFAPPPVAGPGNEAVAGVRQALPVELQRLMAIEVPVIVELGRRRMTVGEVMRLSVGAIIEFHKSSNDDLDLLVNNKPIGRGQAVKVGENFGIRISTMGTVKETIKKLGAS